MLRVPQEVQVIPEVFVADVGYAFLAAVLGMVPSRLRVACDVLIAYCIVEAILHVPMERVAAWVMGL